MNNLLTLLSFLYCYHTATWCIIYSERIISCDVIFKYQQNLKNESINDFYNIYYAQKTA